MHPPNTQTLVVFKRDRARTFRAAGSEQMVLMSNLHKMMNMRAIFLCRCGSNGGGDVVLLVVVAVAGAAYMRHGREVSRVEADAT